MHFSLGEPVRWNCLSSCSRRGFLGLAGASYSAGDHSPPGPMSSMVCLYVLVIHLLGGLSQKVWEATFLETFHDKMICA